MHGRTFRRVSSWTYGAICSHLAGPRITQPQPSPAHTVVTGSSAPHAIACNAGAERSAAINQRCLRRSTTEENFAAAWQRSFGGAEARRRSLRSAEAGGAPPAPGPETLRGWL